MQRQSEMTHALGKIIEADRPRPRIQQASAGSAPDPVRVPKPRPAIGRMQTQSIETRGRAKDKRKSDDAVPKRARPRQAARA
jgi:hypothetical protein